MKSRLNICIFAHSWLSDWNHGNAHFLRGLARALLRMGHAVRCYEQAGAWSFVNLLQNEGARGRQSVAQFRSTYPELDIRSYHQDKLLPQYLERELREADVVMVHEWNDPQVVNCILDYKKQFGFRALFHDTHHRAYTNPRAILQMRLQDFDGVLAFGEAIRKIYVDGFGMQRAWTFHEAADVESFLPMNAVKKYDLIWIGNWGDEERTKELDEFLIAPARALHQRKIAVHGVRYPAAARQTLAESGIEFRGYLPNLAVPSAYAESLLTVHIPRRQYANGLSGIPTIRMFEALACGIPLLCSPWKDSENLFRPNLDYIEVPNSNAMQAEIKNLLHDGSARLQLSSEGLATICKRHTCAHRAQQLTGICEELS